MEPASRDRVPQQRSGQTQSTRNIINKKNNYVLLPRLRWWRHRCCSRLLYSPGSPPSEAGQPHNDSGTNSFLLRGGTFYLAQLIFGLSAGALIAGFLNESREMAVSAISVCATLLGLERIAMIWSEKNQTICFVC